MAKRKNKILNKKQSAAPPTTERDEFTGRYLADRDTALRQWFENAKEVSKFKAEKILIDPKQAVYARKGNKNGKKGS